MQYQAIALRGFQSYDEEQVITISPDVTLLAGRNNVGKSALLRALQVFSQPQHGAHADFRIALTWELPVDRILAAFPPASGNDQIRNWLSSTQTHTFSAAFVRATDAEPINPEQLFCERLELVEMDAIGHGNIGSNIGWETGMFAGSATATGQLASLASQIASAVQYVAPRRIDQGLRILSPQPRLLPDGRNLSEVLLDLQLNQPTTRFRQLVDFMRTAFPEIETFTVRTDPNQQGQTAGEPHVIYEGREGSVPLSLCGTGVEQMLALAVSVLTSPADQLFLIDEPQAYLHPHAERSLLALLERHDEHQYIVATHSGLLLNARPLHDIRVLTLVDGATSAVTDSSPEAILSELGVAATDLWLRDRVLWVEGPSEAEIVGLMADRELDPAARAGLAVKPMPGSASRFSPRSPKQAEATYRFCRDVTSAISPLPVTMRFLFDSDEKGEDVKQQIVEASGERASFLPVRELENLFLDADLIATAVRERCELFDLDFPGNDAIERALEEVLTRTSDRRLFPEDPKGCDPRDVVRGSAALDSIFWEITTSRYEKVADGRAFAEIALRDKPTALDPLRAVLRLAGGS
jgi:hypothetical protein